MDQIPEKIDYPPLLPGGFHKLSLDEVKTITVDPFPNSVRREPLFESLGIYLELIARTGLKCNVWLDGSFTTEKVEPADIDLLLVFEEEQIDKLKPSEFEYLQNLLNNGLTKARFKLDVYYEASQNVGGKAYWRGLYGFQRDEITPKGIILLELNNG